VGIGANTASYIVVDALRCSFPPVTHAARAATGRRQVWPYPAGAGEAERWAA